jgi:hypothetical protein
MTHLVENITDGIFYGPFATIEEAKTWIECNAKTDLNGQGVKIHPMESPFPDDELSQYTDDELCRHCGSPLQSEVNQ